MSYNSEIWDLDEQSYLSPDVQRKIALLDERSWQIAQARLPFTISGYCAVCDSIQPIDFRSNHGFVDEHHGMFHIAYSETGVCLKCKVSSRKRFAVELVRRFAAGPRIYTTEHVTAMREHLSEQFPELRSSEFLGDHAPGTIVDGIRHEDLHNLSFADGSFDVVLCLDVLEHVNDPLLCLQEITRVLGPRGIAIVTFPFFVDRTVSVRRAEIVDGAIAHILPAEYHGNPLGGGSLVFSELSWDFLRRMQDQIQARVRLLHYWSGLSLHLGAHRLAVLIEK